jgi:PadR family transcriptional regulator PadR
MTGRHVLVSGPTILKAMTSRAAGPGCLDILHVWAYMCRMSRRKGDTGAPKSELLQGTLDLLILQVAALGPLHGYAIAQRLQQISNDALQVQQGSLYPALHRLEQRGLLAADWQTTETGREAKFYSLTRTGRKQLELERTNWERLAQAIALVLQTAE